MIMSQNVLPIFSSGSFMVSCLISRSLNHFEFIFVYDVREYSDFTDILVAIQLFSSPLAEETVFSPLYILASFIVD